VQAAIILHCAGSEAIEVIDQSSFTSEEEREDPNVIMTKLEEYCIPRKNEVLESFRFWRTDYKEPFSSFVTELRRRADLCNFQEKERMIRDKIVFSVSKRLQERLLKEKDLTLQKAVEICQVVEQTTKQVTEMQQSQDASVAKVKTYNKQNERERTKMLQSADTGQPRPTINCKFCGVQHPIGRNNCPAWGRTCLACKGQNHFRKRCPRKVHTLAAENRDPYSDSENEAWLSCVSTNKTRATVQLSVNGHPARFQLDTAADVNIICQRYVRKSQTTATHQKLIMWNGTEMKPKGEATLPVVNEKTKKSYSIKFTVVDNKFTCLLSLPTMQEMGLITIHEDKMIAQVSTPESLGDLGTITLQIDAEITPRVMPCRKIPYALKDKVKVELDKLVKRGILVPVEEPTPWVSQMAVVEKSDGNLRLCIDPRPLNEALKREHLKLPTFEDILPELHNAKVFSKLDVKEAFWHLKLDQASSTLTTMITPFGRFRWTRLPFGLKVSSEIFQRHLTQALEGLKGCITVTDDILVAGCGSNESEAENDHDRNLKRLKKRCVEKHINLNDKKCIEKQKEVIFMGHRVSAKGIEPDNRKIEAIINSPAPQNVHEVRRFCGMIQYLARFLNNLSDILKPIRDLTKNDTPFLWSADCIKAFKEIKEKITTAPVLRIYDPDQGLELQVDSSKDALGAVLMQKGQPIEFASRALSQAERNWAQIEKETLAVLYGLERFDQYTYGRKVSVINDHKPLSSILKKPLSQIPRRLQNLMIRISRYDIEFQWVQGKRLEIADYLSRAYNPTDKSETKNVHLNQIISNIPALPDVMMERIKVETGKDRILQDLYTTIMDGWPDRKSNVSIDLTPYYDIRDCLAVENGIIVYGERVLIPKSLRHEVKQKLHVPHLGAESMMRRARQLIYWPGINSEIIHIAKTCEVCQTKKPGNHKETLIQHDTGTFPFEKVATDIFQIEGRQYLVLVDYFSNYLEADYLKSVTSTIVISKLKGHFARYGVPKVLVSDCGSQFTSYEFQQFAKRWGFKHIKSDPGHHQANGKAESAVKIVKSMMLKALENGDDQYEALLELRNTPRQGYKHSPAEIVFGRSCRTLLPFRRSPPVANDTLQRLSKRNKVVKQQFDKSAHNLPDLNVGNPVYYQNPEETQWKKGRIVARGDNRSYTVEGENGGRYKRNRVHLRPKTTVFKNNWDSFSDDMSDYDRCSRPDIPVETTVDLQPPLEALGERPKRATREPLWMKDYVKS
jgi:hypothetical protein